jgi:hypothetical protein
LNFLKKSVNFLRTDHHSLKVVVVSLELTLLVY